VIRNGEQNRLTFFNKTYMCAFAAMYIPAKANKSCYSGFPADNGKLRHLNSNLDGVRFRGKGQSKFLSGLNAQFYGVLNIGERLFASAALGNASRQRWTLGHDPADFVGFNGNEKLHRFNYTPNRSTKAVAGKRADKLGFDLAAIGRGHCGDYTWPRLECCLKFKAYYLYSGSIS
jgi:hypothetical protein